MILVTTLDGERIIHHCIHFSSYHTSWTLILAHLSRCLTKEGELCGMHSVISLARQPGVSLRRSDGCGT
jgi:hypothetical protein